MSPNASESCRTSAGPSTGSGLLQSPWLIARAAAAFGMTDDQRRGLFVLAASFV